MRDVTYRRPVSGIERGYLSSAARGAHPTIHLLLEGEGTLDAAALRQAVEHACTANPGLAVTRHGRWWLGGGPCPSFIEHVEPLADPNAVDAFHSDLDVVRGPVAELHLFDGPSPALVLRASHAVADGRGLEHWLADVFRLLRHEAPLGAPDTAIDRHFVQRSDATCRARRTSDASVRGVSPLAAPLFGNAGTGDHIVWIRRTLPTSAAGMSARIATAVADLAGQESTVIVPVDLRRHDPTMRSTANLSAQLPMRVAPGEGWQCVHGRLLRLLATRAELDTLRGDFRITNPFAATLAQARSFGRDGRRPCAAIISDHGAVDLTPYTTPGFTPTRLSTLPLLVPYVSAFVSSFTSEGATHLTVACRSTDEEARVARLLDLTEHTLSAPAALTPVGAS